MFIRADWVSLACTDPSPTFEWCRPQITHIAWNHAAVTAAVTNPVEKWTNQLSRGKHDRRKVFTQAELIPGGTIGPVPGKA